MSIGTAYTCSVPSAPLQKGSEMHLQSSFTLTEVHGLQEPGTAQPTFSNTQPNMFEGKDLLSPFFHYASETYWKDMSLKLDAEGNCTWPCILHFWMLDKFVLILWTCFWNGILILGQFNLSSKKGSVFRFTTVFSTVSLSYGCTGCGKKKKKKSKMIPTAHWNK